MNKWCVVLALAGSVIACSADRATDPQLVTASTAQMNFVRADSQAPSLANPTVSFWASYDHGGEARIYYHALPALTDSAELLRFTVSSQSIFERPDGSRFGPGDSVLVTITIIDPVNMIAQFEPSGLKFSASNPASLTFVLGHLDPDLNGDGQLDLQDANLAAKLYVWRQEHDGDPWTRLPSLVDLLRGEVSADISGFTHYALAY